MGVEIFVAFEKPGFAVTRSGESFTSGHLPRGGKALAANLDALDARLHKASLPRLQDLISEDESILDFVEDEEVELSWFHADEGVGSVEFCLEEVRRERESFSRSDLLLEDLEDILAALRAAREAGVQFSFRVAI